MLSCVAYQSVINAGHIEGGMDDVHRESVFHMTVDEIPNAEPDLWVLVDGF